MVNFFKRIFKMLLRIRLVLYGVTLQNTIEFERRSADAAKRFRSLLHILFFQLKVFFFQLSLARSYSGTTVKLGYNEQLGTGHFRSL